MKNKFEMRDMVTFNKHAPLVKPQFSNNDSIQLKKAQYALPQSEQRLDNIINSLPDPTFVIDIDGKLIAWNRALEDITGIAAQDMLGKGDYIYSLLFYGTRRPVLIDLVLNPQAGNPEDFQDYTFIERNKDTLVAEMYVPRWRGLRAYLWCVANPLYDSQGNLMGAIESVRDITDRKLTEEALRISEEKFSRAFNSSPISLNPGRRIHSG